MNNINLLIAKILRKFKLPIKLNQKFNDWRHKKISKQLEPFFLNVKYEENKTGINNKKIWIFWWQGLEEMPEIVKACYQSVLQNKGKADVILITKENVRNYAKVPEYIYQKVNTGKISLTHFSDLLRFNLLNQYGGLWLDATMFVTSELSEDYFKREIFTCAGHEDKEHFFIASGRWCLFFIGGKSHQALFSFINNALISYWENNDKITDYFLTDYALDYAYRKNIGNFKYYCKVANGKEPNIFLLEKCLNEPYCESKLKQIEKDTNVFKLSYKKKLKENKYTFYNELVLKAENKEIYNNIGDK